MFATIKQLFGKGVVIKVSPNQSFPAIIGLFLLCFGVFGCIAVSSKSHEGEVVGILKDSEGRAVGGIISMNGIQVMTDAAGGFDFGHVPSGQYPLSVAIGGTQVHEQSVDVTPGMTSFSVTVSLDDVTNLLPNPTWEGAPEMPIGWRMHGAKSILNDTIFLVPDPDLSDDWLVKINDPDGTAYGFKSAALPVREGATYKATVTGRAGNPDDSDAETGRAGLYLEFFDERGVQMDAGSSSRTNTTWGTLTVIRPVPEDAVSVGDMAYSSSSIVGEAYFKDVKLEITE